MITNLQVLRGIAAFAVVFYHTAYVLPVFGHTEFMAVPVFFVISGYVMAYISKQTAGEFILNRFARIVPFYWLVTGFAFVWASSGLQNPMYTFPAVSQAVAYGGIQSGIAFMKNLFAGNATPDRLTMLVKSLAFRPVPFLDRPTLGVGWSLNLEVFYYCVFALSLLASRRFGPMITAGALLLLMKPYQASDMHSSYRTFYNVFFAEGIFVFYAWKLLVEIELPNSIMKISGLFFLILFLAGQFSEYLLFITPSFAVIGCVMLHSSGIRSKTRFLVFLGDASYALYLTHEIVIETCRPFWAHWPALNPANHLLSSLGLCLLATLIAAATHIFVERPVVQLARSALSSKRTSTPETASVVQP